MLECAVIEISGRYVVPIFDKLVLDSALTLHYSNLGGFYISVLKPCEIYLQINSAFKLIQSDLLYFPIGWYFWTIFFHFKLNKLLTIVFFTICVYITSI